MFDAWPGIFDGGHLSSAGDFSFANIFFPSISLLASDGPLVDDMTSTGWLMKASPKQDQSTQNLLKWPEKPEPLIVSGYPRDDFPR